ncbi:hypothetical protein TGP89_246150 [Toxoplasma gondii p89]|uniref:Uncharacterized protein n=1 Tax=Toxoplasma gondii p89 TaxID=943119 RepID=A0A086KTX7_TOXGO|nr:hypothetical protein TGP89_246150 [Toxoplasma gondii p89]
MFMETDRWTAASTSCKSDTQRRLPETLYHRKSRPPSVLCRLHGSSLQKKFRAFLRIATYREAAIVSSCLCCVSSLFSQRKRRESSLRDQEPSSLRSLLPRHLSR